MPEAFGVGQITAKDPEKWAQYRPQVMATLLPDGGKLVFRGQQLQTFSGVKPHPDIVVIRFPSSGEAEGCHGSAACQALIPLRQEAADIV